MKRTILLIAGIAVLATAYGTARLGAQVPTAQPVPAATKVAIVNIGDVFQNYAKAQFFKYEMEQQLKPIRDEVEKLNKLITDWQAALRSPKLTPEQKAQGERTIVDAKRRLEDLDRDARKQIGKRNEEQIVQLFKEVNEKIQAYAQSNGFHIVLGYGDLPKTDPYAFMNIARKMQAMDAGGLVNIYCQAGLDISPAVVNALNTSYTGPRPPAPPVTGTTTGQQK